MPKSSWAPPKAMRGKCERGHGSVNADGGSVNAGAEVQTQTGRVRKPSRAMGTRRGRLSAPWPRFHGVDRADVYIIIHVRACCCGECALNPPTSQPIPRRRPSLAPAQRHALPEHFRSPTQPRRTPSGCAMHSPPTSPPIPRRRPSLAPSIFSRPSRALPPSPTQPRRTPAQRHALPEHFRSPMQPRRTPAGCAMHARSAQCIPRCPHNPFPTEDLRPPRTATRPSRAFSHPLPEHFRPPPQPRRIPSGCAMHACRPHNTFPVEDLLPPPRSDAPCPSIFSLPPRADAHPQAARCIPRRPHNTFPAEDLRSPPHNDAPFPNTFSSPSPALLPHPRSPDAHPQAARYIPRRRPSPPPPFRFGHKKNGTAQWMCDAECLGRPSLRSVIGVGEPRAVRRRCGALAWRVGLRPQPWALRSRRCGRVLRA